MNAHDSTGQAQRRFGWRRFDTLGLRLFVLMWVTLVVSHLVAYSLAMPLTMSNGPSPLERLTSQRVPTMPSLPPGGPLPGLAPGGGPGPQQGPPQGAPRSPPGLQQRGQRPAQEQGPQQFPQQPAQQSPQQGPRHDGRPGPPPHQQMPPPDRAAPAALPGTPPTGMPITPRSDSGLGQPIPPPNGNGGPDGRPDGGPDGNGEPGSPGSNGLPAATLWLDYGLRMAIVALGAALGARWLARPMQRLSRAAGDLSQGLARGQPPPVLNEAQGTAEVREAARVFNGMASRLQEQFDARGMHLASVSHDLRTPLTRLRMRLEDIPPEMEALAAGAAGDIHEMSEMIDSTLEVLHEQREGSQARTVDIVALLQALVDDLAIAGQDVELTPAAPQRMQTLTPMPTPTPTPTLTLTQAQTRMQTQTQAQVQLQGDAQMHVQARPAALKRIAGNLIGNALRYGGCARLAVQLHDGGVLVTVDDNGPGIPPDQLELAFRPWVRLTQAHARSGHGLGLAIARDLAERDGCQLTLVNRTPNGLQARLWLPLPLPLPLPAASAATTTA